MQLVCEQKVNVKNKMEDVEKEIALIDSVETKPCLFNKKDQNYKNRTAKAKAWESIGQQLGQSADDCIAKWKSLISQYLAHQRKLRSPSGSGAGKRPFFRHEDRMKFLNDVYSEERTISNFKTEVGDLESSVIWNEEDVLSEVKAQVQVEEKNQDLPKEPEHSISGTSSGPNVKKSKPPAKRKLDPVEEEMLRMLQSEDEDEFSIFGRLMATKLRKIHGVDKKAYRDAQYLICTIMNDAENKVFQDNSDK